MTTLNSKIKSKRRKKIGSVQQKVLLLLSGGLALGFSRTPRQYFRIVGAMTREWKEINRRSLENAIGALYRSRLIEEKHNPDGTTTMVLTELGKKTALTFNIDSMKIHRPNRWDGMWRIVISDIPEGRKRGRESLRMHLKQLGFYPLQKSVYVHPFDCKKEIDFIVEFHMMRKYVRFILAYSIDNELHLKKHFELL